MKTPISICKFPYLLGSVQRLNGSPGRLFQLEQLLVPLLDLLIVLTVFNLQLVEVDRLKRVALVFFLLELCLDLVGWRQMESSKHTVKIIPFVHANVTTKKTIETYTNITVLTRAQQTHTQRHTRM
jgi:hypothetical protein